MLQTFTPLKIRFLASQFREKLPDQSADRCLLLGRANPGAAIDFVWK